MSPSEHEQDDLHSSTSILNPNCRLTMNLLNFLKDADKLDVLYLYPLQLKRPYP